MLDELTALFTGVLNVGAVVTPAGVDGTDLVETTAEVTGGIEVKVCGTEEILVEDSQAAESGEEGTEETEERIEEITEENEETDEVTEEITEEVLLAGTEEVAEEAEVLVEDSQSSVVEVWWCSWSLLTMVASSQGSVLETTVLVVSQSSVLVVEISVIQGSVLVEVVTSSSQGSVF